eukprot:195821-Rhodomonas_salina.3
MSVPDMALQARRAMGVSPSALGAYPTPCRDSSIRYRPTSIRDVSTPLLYQHTLRQSTPPVPAFPTTVPHIPLHTLEQYRALLEYQHALRQYRRHTADA